MTKLRKLSSYLAEHPTCVTALGLGPLVAKSATLISGLTISAGFVLIFLLGSVTLSLIRNLVPHRFRLAFILLICSVWTSVFDLLLQAYFYDLRMTLQIYVPLLAMNSLILMLLEKESLTSSVLKMAIRSVAVSVGPVFICVMTGLIREILAHGWIFTDRGLINPDSNGTTTAAVITLPLFDTVAGAFIIAGCVLALINYLGPKPDRLMQANGDYRS